MIKINKTKVYGLDESIMCLKYSFDPKYEIEVEFTDKQFDVAKKCCNTPTGSGHDSILKGILVQCDLEAPHYWLPQLMRYHWIDFVMSTSKMHSLTKMNLNEVCTPEVFKETKVALKMMIEDFNEEEDADEKKRMWKSILANCPLGLMLRARISTNYMQLKTIYHQRCMTKHKLQEWEQFGDWCDSLPKFNELTGMSRKE